MAVDHADTDAAPRRAEPVVRSIEFHDIGEALAAGLRDFQRAPLYGLFFGAIYTVGGLLLIATVFAWNLSYLAYPLAAGFALIGPFVAVGLYEVSRRLETGQPLSWGAVLGCVFAQSGRELGWMAFVTLFVFLIWMYQIRLFIALFFGFHAFEEGALLQTLFGTPEGWLFLALGHLDGAVLSLILFTLTVVSFPLLLDRDVDFITAMITSVRAVARSPVPMLAWGLIVALVLIAACLPGFLGLLVALPVLGHTTWHLYRRLVEPEAGSGLSGSKSLPF